jgi:hypothetical protein
VKHLFDAGKLLLLEAIHFTAQRKIDCFAESVIGRAFARPVGFAMTKTYARDLAARFRPR